MTLERMIKKAIFRANTHYECKITSEIKYESGMIIFTLHYNNDKFSACALLDVLYSKGDDESKIYYLVIIIQDLYETFLNSVPYPVKKNA